MTQINDMLARVSPAEIGTAAALRHPQGYYLCRIADGVGGYQPTGCEAHHPTSDEAMACANRPATSTIARKPLKKVSGDSDMRSYQALCPNRCGYQVWADWVAEWEASQGFPYALNGGFDGVNPEVEAHVYTLAEAHEHAGMMLGAHLTQCDAPPLKPMKKVSETDFDGIKVRYYEYRCGCGWKILAEYDSSIKDDGGSCPYRIWGEDAEGSERQDLWLWDAETAAEMHSTAREWIAEHDCEGDAPTEPEGLLEEPTCWAASHDWQIDGDSHRCELCHVVRTCDRGCYRYHIPESEAALIAELASKWQGNERHLRAVIRSQEAHVYTLQNYHAIAGDLPVLHRNQNELERLRDALAVLEADIPTATETEAVGDAATQSGAEEADIDAIIATIPAEDLAAVIGITASDLGMCLDVDGLAASVGEEVAIKAEAIRQEANRLAAEAEADCDGIAALVEADDRRLAEAVEADMEHGPKCAKGLNVYYGEEGKGIYTLLERKHLGGGDYECRQSCNTCGLTMTNQEWSPNF